MPKLSVFGCEKLKKACIKLGFEISEDKGKGGHILAKHPTIEPGHGQRPFIAIPSWKEYGDPNFRNEVVRQLQAYGFTRDTIINTINDA